MSLERSVPKYYFYDDKKYELNIDNIQRVHRCVTNIRNHVGCEHDPYLKDFRAPMTGESIMDLVYDLKKRRNKDLEKPSAMERGDAFIESMAGIRELNDIMGYIEGALFIVNDPTNLDNYWKMLP